VCAAGDPVMLAEPGRPCSKLTPDGNVPVSVMFGVGEPLALTAKSKDAPTVTVAPEADVKTGPWLTVRTKAWVPGDPIPLAALMVIG
jgi:hypothetical protein